VQNEEHAEGGRAGLPEGWGKILTGAVLGSASGVAALLLYTNGLFVTGLSQEFGLTRTQFGLGVLLVTLALAAANPVVGWAIDRFSVKMPAIAGLLLLSAGFVSLGAVVQSTGSYLLLQSLVAFVGAGSGTIAFTKIIGATFQKHRGIALGITMTGIGCSAAVLPPLLSEVIAAHGWRAGYFALALVPLFGALATAVLIPRRLPLETPASGQPRSASTRASGSGPWVRSRVFWIMAATFAIMSLSFAGLLPHFVPMLTDAGLSPVAAGRVAGEIGLAVIASRLLVGYLMDRTFAPGIAIGVCVIAAGGAVLFIANGTSSASLTAIALGVAIGSELDLMGFLIAKYFNLAEFGRVYGWLYCAFALGSGLGPLWVGALRDATGAYTLPLALCACGLIAACVGFLLLPRYRATAAVALST
jgi:MFS family permease